MREAEVRDGHDDKEGSVRMKWNRQYIVNSTLKGEHAFLDDGALRLARSAVISKAYSETRTMQKYSCKVATYKHQKRPDAGGNITPTMISQDMLT